MNCEHGYNVFCAECSTGKAETEASLRQQLEEARASVDRIKRVAKVRTKQLSMASERTTELECMVKIFRGCIETGVLPKQGSRCHKIIYELVGEPDDSDEAQQAGG